jgi:hypothetical protein
LAVWPASRPPTPSLTERCWHVSAGSDAPPVGFGPGMAGDEELVPLHDVHSFIKAPCQSGLGSLRHPWVVAGGLGSLA